MQTGVRTGQMKSGRSFSHYQIPKGVLITENQAAAASLIP